MRSFVSYLNIGIAVSMDTMGQAVDGVAVARAAPQLAAAHRISLVRRCGQIVLIVVDPQVTNTAVQSSPRHSRWIGLTIGEWGKT